ncbi:MAG: nitrogen fixation protein NifW [Chromatiaceae bacterium]|nr:MAG: nitrogen fixation protein NifW [Chromatiaceae bacterium]
MSEATLAQPLSLDDFETDLAELESAEDFLGYFGIAFDPAVVHVNRLHILQRFHDYLAEIEEEPDSVGARFRLYADLLQGAYRDFVHSDARTEKVFRVFQRLEPRPVNIGLDTLLAQLPPVRTGTGTHTTTAGHDASAL